MTGWLDFIVGDKAGDPSTERLFHGTSEIRNFILSQTSSASKRSFFRSPLDVE